jgi:hypothetical protein
MKVIFTVVIAIVVLIGVREAFAYIDPTAGGTLIQILLAGGTGILIFAQQIWNRIRMRKRRRGDPVGVEPHPTSDTNAKDSFNESCR